MRALRKLVGLLRSFGLFWWDFIVGDDVTLAAGVAIGLAAVYALHKSHVAAWWLLPILWALALGVSLMRAARRAS